MKPQEMIFWIIVGISAALLIILFTNTILANMMKVSVTASP
jgi:hypothetical protein